MPNADRSPKKHTEPSARLTLCLAMDLKGSTRSGLELTSKRLDRFNLALVHQLTPHLHSVGLESAVVKFTGDGWLVMSDEQDHVAPMCCLARIMGQRFQVEMSRESGIAQENIPALRLAVCSGRDLAVVLHDGQRDFVGGSVRRAVRACQLCRDNEILVDDTVRTWIQQDFLTHRVDLEERLAHNPDAKMEEDLALHVLDKLKVESAIDPDAPVYYVNTLAILGRIEAADTLAHEMSDHLVEEARSPGANQAELLEKWNRLLQSELDYGTAREILDDLRVAGIRPDVRTFNALILRCEGSRAESRWLEIMLQEGIAPNAETFKILVQKSKDEATAAKRLEKMEKLEVQPNTEVLNALLAKAESYATAARWMERLVRTGVGLDAQSYALLVEKAEDFETARLWIEAMIEVGVEPEEMTFVSLFGKDLSRIDADWLLGWYLGLRYHPAKPIQRAIANYRRHGKIRDALRLALDYPHTQTALKTMRQFPTQALAYFESVVRNDPDHPNGNYALGMALYELGRADEAEQWLRKARDLAGHGPRRDELDRYLERLDAVRRGVKPL